MIDSVTSDGCARLMVSLYLLVGVEEVRRDNCSKLAWVLSLHLPEAFETSRLLP